MRLAKIRPSPWPHRQAVRKNKTRKETHERPKYLAGAASQRVAGYLRNASPVDTDRGQGSPRPDAAHEPLVGGSPLVSAVGLTTSAIPYEGETFEIEFDFVHHQLLIPTSQGTEK